MPSRAHWVRNRHAKEDSGNEIGPFRAVEESTIAHLTPKDALPDIYAWYSLTGTAGTALGLMVCGWILNVLELSKGWDYIPACRIIFFVYAGIGVVKLVLVLTLSSQVEAVKPQKKTTQPLPPSEPQNPETEPLLGRADNGAASEEQHQQQPSEPTKKKQRRTFLFLSLPDPQFTGLVASLCFLFGLDAFASGLASL
jgi:MFS family permease